MVSINGHDISDVLDYGFYAYDARLELLLRRKEEQMLKRVKKNEGEELGLDFDTYLMDRQKSCQNKCVFCFIDQLPQGLRPTLYVKDDDARMSFLLGNYISMTNLSDEDAQRIINMKLTPINISVHTTDPELRSKMLGNKRGGESLKYLYMFAENGIGINAQIVVCPGLNDQSQLEKTLRDLSSLSPAIESIAVVPVGLTRFRNRLTALEPVTKEKAEEILCQVDRQRQINLQTGQSALCYTSDELFLRANHSMPPEEYYEGYPQLENGIGLMRSFEQELRDALTKTDSFPTPEPFTVVTGCVAEKFMREMVDLIGQKCNNLSYLVAGVENRFFGPAVDVAGLVTGGDIVHALQGKVHGSRLLLPACMLRHGETVFLDDMPLSKLESLLGCQAAVTEVDGYNFLQAVLQQNGNKI